MIYIYNYILLIWSTVQGLLRPRGKQVRVVRGARATIIGSGAGKILTPVGFGVLDAYLGRRPCCYGGWHFSPLFQRESIGGGNNGS